MLVSGLSYDDLAIRDGAEHEWNNIVTGAYHTAKAATTSPGAVRLLQARYTGDG